MRLKKHLHLSKKYVYGLKIFTNKRPIYFIVYDLMHVLWKGSMMVDLHGCFLKKVTVSYLSSEKSVCTITIINRNRNSAITVSTQVILVEEEPCNFQTHKLLPSRWGRFFSCYEFISLSITALLISISSL